ncbi:MAG: hypothetical protein H6832_09690 [Planctomycetes bacterium]|nr:hypothetical protein [Planctomycetota bacterium]MCB9918662.1 hypothetical protein [Planctomycetota bacterium]
MRTSLSALLASGLVATSLVAQNYHVSPVVAATNEGAGSNAFPFSSSVQRRYQQIHSDMPATTMSIKAIGFRNNASSSTYTGSKQLDIELFMGRTVAWNQCSFFFDNNWVQNSKMQVIKRKTITFGAGAASSPGPSPFDPTLELKLDAPYIYIPTTGSLGWELLMHNYSATGTNGTIDVDVSSNVTGTDSPTTTGCTAGGQTLAMTHSVEISDRCGTLIMLFSARYCPANAPSLLIIGTQNLNVPIPGLCANLATDLLIALPFGVSDANGDLHRQSTAYYYGAAGGVLLVPNPGAGTIYSQIFSLDTTQTGIPFAASNGLALSIPAADTSKKCEVTRLFNNSGGVTEPMSAVFHTSSAGYGLVTRFTY